MFSGVAPSIGSRVEFGRFGFGGQPSGRLRLDLALARTPRSGGVPGLVPGAESGGSSLRAGQGELGRGMGRAGEEEGKIKENKRRIARAELEIFNPLFF